MEGLVEPVNLQKRMAYRTNHLGEDHTTAILSTERLV
jgi:hypothetical protein